MRLILLSVLVDKVQALILNLFFIDLKFPVNDKVKVAIFALGD